MSSVAASVLVFCTSAAVLVLEILAGRLVAPYVGVSLETYTGIIGTVLAGIALGSGAGGRLADTFEPRRLLGPALVLGGVLALLALPIVTLLGPAIAASGGGPVAVVVLAFTAFFAPAAVLSSVSPMAAKLRLATLKETGSVVGGLSAASTGGALVGTFLTGFVLVAALPSRPIVIGLGVALAAAGLVLGRRVGGGPGGERGRNPGTAVMCALAVVGGVAALTPVPCQQETAYFCAQVQADPGRPSGRALVLDNLRHSYVDLDDPTHLEFRYVRLLADVLDGVAPGSRRVDGLHIGGGGFSFPRYVNATRPGSTNTVLELDDELVGIAERQLGLRRGPNLQVRVGDARTALTEERTGSYDLVVGDAFGGLAAPWHLTTRQVVDEVARVLRPGGVYAVNIVDGGPRRFVRAEAATFAEVFDEVAVIEPPDRGYSQASANHVLVASKGALPRLQVDPADGVVVRGEEAQRFLEGAQVLTDDFAPVDQLITRR